MTGKPERKSTDVAIVGGGPAGLMAAGEAAVGGSAAVLLEGGDSPGRKLLLTGRGRCNLTNTLPLSAFIEEYGPRGRFLRNAYHRFFSEELVSFLNGIGVPTARERGGRIYPASGEARGVLEALERFVLSSGAGLETGRRVRRIERTAGGSFILAGEGFSLDARRVVLATGGASFPWTGSRGDGYLLAESLGHTVEPPRPALVPLRCRGPASSRLSGLRLKNVALSYRSKKEKTFFGEVHFTDFGISGPAVFVASREIGVLAEKDPLPVRIDLKPALDEKKLDGRILREIGAGATEPLNLVMARLLPASMVGLFLEMLEISPEIRGGEVTREMRRGIVMMLKGFPLTVTGTLPIERAMVTAGGVRLREVDPATMESRRVPGLFFCGEILDIDGSTGGFNLQAAFSTGFLAGRNAGGRGAGEE